MHHSDDTNNTIRTQVKGNKQICKLQFAVNSSLP